MVLEVRPAEPSEMPEVVRVASMNLTQPPELLKALRPEWTLCAFEDGRLVTTYSAWPLTMRFNGQAAPIAGVCAVGTLPAYRRRGYLRKVTEAHFAHLHQQGERPIALLHASQVAIYLRYGYAVVSTRVSYQMEPRSLQFAHPLSPSGELREVGEEAFGLLVELYRQFRAERTGYVHRGRAMWDASILAPPPPGGYLSTVVYQEREPLGYLVYTVEPRHVSDDSSRQHIEVRDLVWLTSAAYQALWNHLHTMDLAGSIAWTRVPPDDPLPHLVQEPRMLHAASRDGTLGRIVDVERALPMRRYGADGTLTFEVLDDICPWNRGRWRLAISGQECTVERTTASPQLAMPVSALALLAFGQISATEAWRMGRLDALDPGALPLWDAVMRTAYRPACADLF